MKVEKALLILVLLGFIAGSGIGYSETIYTKDGEEIQGKITEITEDTIWVEGTVGDITEYIGIDKTNIQKILNDGGGAYTYSPIKK